MSGCSRRGTTASGFIRRAGGSTASGGRWVAAALVDRVLEWLRGRSLMTFSLGGRNRRMHRPRARVIRNRLASTDG